MSAHIEIAPSRFRGPKALKSTAQGAWLNGYLAGLFSNQPGGAATAPATAPVKIKVSVLFGSETGNAEALAKRVAKAAGQHGFEAKALGLDKISAKHLAQEKYV